MSVFSLKWFTARKADPLYDLKVEEQQLKNEILRKQISPTSEKLEKEKVGERPYRKVTLVNDILTIVMNDGSVFCKSESTQDDFIRMRTCSTEEEILDAIKVAGNEKEKDEIKRVTAIGYGFEKLKSTGDFTFTDSSVYMKGISRTLPQLLVEKFSEIASKYDNPEDVKKDEEYIALKRFFMWCCLNPRAEVADKLYGFLMRNGLKVTKQGLFVSLRNVVDVSPKDNDLVHFISNAYNKVKAVWKRRPEDFNVQQCNCEYSLNRKDQEPKGTVIGNLSELYLDLPNMRENRFTDNYTKTFDIRIGKKVSMLPSECNWSTADCAHAGLHFAGHTAPYVLCGDTTVFTLINPMKVVGIGNEKGRCYEYLPFMTTSVDEANEIMNEGNFDFLQLDEQYAVEELENLEENVKKGFAIESRKHEFNLPHISTIEIGNIVKSLNEMKEVIKKRVVEVK